jgi:release factor glutamine methyltransferase
MTAIGEWRRDLTARLRPVAGELASYESHRILGHLFNCGPTELTLRAGEEVTTEHAQTLEEFVRRRLNGEPLAYVLGSVEFHGIELRCDKRALIPRPETEELVEIALSRLPQPVDGRHPLVVDVGTGCGNIAFALAHARPDLHVFATDTEAPALALANENRQSLELRDRVALLHGRTLTMFREQPLFDMVATNPPYIALGDPNLEESVVANEPRAALFAGRSGLEVIGELLSQSVTRLKRGGWLICEIGYDQSPSLRELIDEIPGWRPPEFHRDTAGIDRVLALRRLS